MHVYPSSPSGWSVTLFPGLVLIMALLVVDVVYERNHRAGCTSNDVCDVMYLSSPTGSRRFHEY